MTEENGNGSEDFEEQGGDNVQFRLGNHPVTGEPLLYLSIKDRKGGQAEIPLDANNGIALGAQITAQSIYLNVLTQFAQQAAAAQAQQRLVVPPGTKR